MAMRTRRSLPTMLRFRKGTAARSSSIRAPPWLRRLVDDKRIIGSQRFGGGFNVASHDPPSNSLYCAICNGFQYATSIMTTSLRQNLVDLEQFYSDVAANQLPAVTFVKPDVLLDGHPGSSHPRCTRLSCAR